MFAEPHAHQEDKIITLSGLVPTTLHHPLPLVRAWFLVLLTLYRENTVDRLVPLTHLILCHPPQRHLFAPASFHRCTSARHVTLTSGTALKFCWT